MSNFGANKSVFLRDHPIVCSDDDLKTIFDILTEFKELCLGSELNEFQDKTLTTNTKFEQISIIAKNARGISTRFHDVESLKSYNRRHPESIVSIDFSFGERFRDSHLFLSLNNEIGNCISYTIQGQSMHVEYIDSKIETLLQQSSPWYSLLAKQNTNLLMFTYHPLIFFLGCAMLQNTRNGFNIDFLVSLFFDIAGVTCAFLLLAILTFTNRLRRIMIFLFPPVDFSFGAGAEASKQREGLRNFLIFAPLTFLLLPLIQEAITK